MTSEIEVGILSVQECKEGIPTFKILTKVPQSINESAGTYNTSILHVIDDLPNVTHQISLDLNCVVVALSPNNCI